MSPFFPVSLWTIVNSRRNHHQKKFQRVFKRRSAADYWCVYSTNHQVYLYEESELHCSYQSVHASIPLPPFIPLLLIPYLPIPPPVSLPSHLTSLCFQWCAESCHREPWGQNPGRSFQRECWHIPMRPETFVTVTPMANVEGAASSSHVFKLSLCSFPLMACARMYLSTSEKEEWGLNKVLRTLVRSSRATNQPATPTGTKHQQPAPWRRVVAGAKLSYPAKLTS